MFFEMIRQFDFTLSNLDAILGKAEKHAEAKKFDVNNFMAQRIAPDMLPFARQVQIACDVAKIAGAYLAGKEAPKHEDNETTVAQLRERIRMCRAYLETLRAADFANTTATTLVKVNYPPGKAMYAGEFLLTRAVPNFFFHVTTTYAILRAGGVDLGKMDYLGNIHVFDA